MQPGVVEAQLRAGVDARLLPEPDPGVEVPQPDAGGQAHRPLLSRALPGALPRRGGHRDWGRGRDVAFLERVQQGPLPEGDQVRAQPLHGHPLGCLYFCEVLYYYILYIF